MMARKGRKLSPEQLEKMREGKRRAAEHRAARAECDAMLDELDARLRAGRSKAGMPVKPVKARRRRRK